MWKRALPAVLLLGVGSGCGAGGSGSSSGAGCPSSETVDILSTGFSTKSVCVAAAGHLVFANMDSVTHTVNSSTPACAATLDSTIAAGTNHSIALPNVNGTCGFFDTAHPGDPAFIGTLTAVGGSTGGGY
jgi:hypothetical protein